MPIIKSAKKRVRQTKRRNARNTITKDKMKSAIKDAEGAIASKSKKAPELMSLAQSTIDTAVKKNQLNKRTAARKKAKLAAKAKAAGIKPATKAKKKAPAKKPAPKKTTAKKKSPAKKKPAAKKK